MKKKIDISEIDKNTWEDYTKNPKDIFDKEKAKIISNSNKHRLKYDLHGFTLREANKKLEELIAKCYDEKYSEILLITGKGIHSNSDKDVYASKDLSKLKFSVPNYIKSNSILSKKVSSISVADKHDGGEGALIIKINNL